VAKKVQTQPKVKQHYVDTANNHHPQLIIQEIQTPPISSPLSKRKHCHKPTGRRLHNTTQHCYNSSPHNSSLRHRQPWLKVDQLCDLVTFFVSAQRQQQQQQQQQQEGWRRPPQQRSWQQPRFIDDRDSRFDRPILGKRPRPDSSWQQQQPNPRRVEFQPAYQQQRQRAAPVFNPSPPNPQPHSGTPGTQPLIFSSTASQRRRRRRWHGTERNI